MCLGDDKRRLPPKTVFVQVKRCPACHYPIEKNGGCPHMTCSRCHKQFCWLCRADWQRHNYSHCRQVPEIVSHILLNFRIRNWPYIATLLVLHFVGTTSSWPPSWKYGVIPEIRLRRQSIRIYWKNNPAKFRPDLIWNDGAFDIFWKMVVQQEKEE